MMMMTIRRGRSDRCAEGGGDLGGDMALDSAFLGEWRALWTGLFIDWSASLMMCANGGRCVNDTADQFVRITVSAILGLPVARAVNIYVSVMRIHLRQD